MRGEYARAARATRWRARVQAEQMRNLARAAESYGKAANYLEQMGDADGAFAVRLDGLRVMHSRGSLRGGAHRGGLGVHERRGPAGAGCAGAARCWRSWGSFPPVWSLPPSLLRAARRVRGGRRRRRRCPRRRRSGGARRRAHTPSRLTRLVVPKPPARPPGTPAAPTGATRRVPLPAALGPSPRDVEISPTDAAAMLAASAAGQELGARAAAPSTPRLPARLRSTASAMRTPASLELPVVVRSSSPGTRAAASVPAPGGSVQRGCDPAAPSEARGRPSRPRAPEPPAPAASAEPSSATTKPSEPRRPMLTAPASEASRRACQPPRLRRSSRAASTDSGGRGVPASPDDAGRGRGLRAARGLEEGGPRPLDRRELPSCSSGLPRGRRAPATPRRPSPPLNDEDGPAEDSALRGGA